MNESIIFRRLGAVLALAVLASCGSGNGLDDPLFSAPETAVEYEVEINGLPNEEMEALAESALATYLRQEDGAQSLPFLKRRAESDIPTVIKLLRSQGFYEGEVEVEVAQLGDEGDADPAPEPAAEGETDETPDIKAKVTFDVTPGDRFVLEQHRFVIRASGGQPEFDAIELGSPVGRAAAAEPILDAETRALAMLQNDGYPYAVKGNRRAVADLEANTLRVTSPFNAGPLSVFGEVVFEGLDRVKPEYLRTYIDWQPGQTFSNDELRNYQEELLATDLFNTISVLPPQKRPEEEAPVALPVIVKAEEREPRTASAAIRYNTDRGPALELGFEHRNLFGANETFTAESEIGLELQSIGFGYTEPQFLRDGQEFVTGLEIKREEDDAFDAQTATLTAGINRQINPFWKGGVGGLLEASLIDDSTEGEAESYLAGIPLFAEYDGSNDLLNPTSGIRYRADLTPFAGIFDDEFSGFLTFDNQGSTYYDITDEGKWVLAGRGRFGVILSEDNDTVPQTRRLYAGGGGSVRGFAQRFIGPIDANNDPIGGRSVVELGGEIRARFGDLGGVLFVEAGAVAEEQYPSFSEGVQVGAGIGFRYFSPAGPIRVDVAFPVNGRDVDDPFQLFFSIGQAF